MNDPRFILWFEAMIDFRDATSRAEATRVWREEAESRGLTPGRFQPIIKAEDAQRSTKDLESHPGDPYRSVWSVKGVVTQ